jgi:hypothetical protein
MDNPSDDDEYGLIKEESGAIDAAFKVTEFCLYQCNNDYNSKCYANCFVKWINGRVFAQKIVGEIVDLSNNEPKKES